MTYFGFLAIFLILPILVMTPLWLRVGRRQFYSMANSGFPVVMAILVHVIIAVVWTTPWDNYLVATSVWWYDINLVTGITIGYVPIEEYSFFVLQPIMTGLFVALLLSGSKRTTPLPDNPARIRIIALASTFAIWLVSGVLLISNYEPATYMGLELIWALPPMMIQLYFGAHILWRYRRIVAVAILTPTVFLSLADALAINTGIWTISPEQSLGILLGGILPVEEALFFLLTNTLVTFGVTLSLSYESKLRINELTSMFRGLRYQVLKS